MSTCLGKKRAVHQFTARVFRERLSFCVCVLVFSFGFESGMWHLIV